MTVREQFIVGIDLGGTNIAAGVMPTDGTREIAMRMVPTRAEEGAAAVVERIGALRCLDYSDQWTAYWAGRAA